MFLTVVHLNVCPLKDQHVADAVVPTQAVLVVGKQLEQGAFCNNKFDSVDNQILITASGLHTHKKKNNLDFL